MLVPSCDDAVTSMNALVYVSDQQPGIRRVRRGRGFSYASANGALRPDDLARIRRLAIPPAWTDVWICPDPNGHVQATGRDAKGRKQYRYHDAWREERDRDKYERLAFFGRGLGRLRGEIEDRLTGSRAPTKERVVSLVIALLDETLIRIGNEEYTTNGAFGLTTLHDDHVSWSGDAIRFRFNGKSGVEHDIEVRDPRLARWVRRCHQLGGHQLFTYATPDGEVVPVTSTDVNEQLRELMVGEVSAKDFRTWGGTSVVTEILATHEGTLAGDDKLVERAVIDAIDEAAQRLGNTRAVCRSSYVHPTVVDAARSGALQETWRRARATKHLRRAETTLLKLIDP